MPLWLAVAAAFALDLVWPLLLLAGVEHVRVSPGDTAFTGLAFERYPWTHSLALVIIWSIIAFQLTRSILGGKRTAAVVGVLVLSHWLLDFVVHRPDLPLWPAGPRVGLGLWQSVPATFAVEGVLFLVGLAAYLRATTARDAIGRWGLVGLLVVTVGIWVLQPWSPPPPSAKAVAAGGLALWVLLPWARLVDVHRRLTYEAFDPTPDPSGHPE